MNEHSQTLKADLFLLHAPSVYDFRERDDILFAYLSDSDSVNVTSIYEMYPLGFFAIKQRLREHGFQAEIVNLASLMLMHPQLDVDALLARLEAPVFGIDLHWMAHCHGSIEIAKRLKAIHPEALVIFGGISSTYYADQLIQYPAVDVVVKGYDTLEPVTLLMEAVKRGERVFNHIPNLVYKKNRSEIIATGFTHKPMKNYNDATVDWSYYKETKNVLGQSKLIMTLPNTGCAHDCPWCGGSRFSTRNIMGIQKTLVTKDNQRVIAELHTLADAAKATSIYALQCYSETKTRLHQFLDAVKEMQYKSVYFEQFHLPTQDTLEKMGQSTEAYIMLSPESHDPIISKLAGRGNYTMAEMEEWIPRALDAGIAGVMVWFFIGMPQQTPDSVFDTVSYSASLLRKFRGKNVLPLICPMVPFLDPGSRFFEEPNKHGYRIFHKTLEQHRQAMVEPLWYKRLNYETDWLSRRDMQDVTYEAIARLVTIKGELGVLPSAFCRSILKTIDETKFLLTQMEHALELDGELPVDLRDAIRVYNRKILAYSSDQIIPMPRPFGGRWYDDFTIPSSMVKELLISASTAKPSVLPHDAEKSEAKPRVYLSM
jgi:clorobiocin biosynthesis protein CloN6